MPEAGWTEIEAVMTPLNIRKLANAFIPGAIPSEVLPSAALSAVTRFKRKHGGLWVGGTVVVTHSGVSFAPNDLNRAFHDELQTISVPAANIRAVRHEFGWFTGIVVITHAAGEFRFRCYGAKKLAATLTAAYGEQRKHAQA
jgi:hypothetical protein